MEAYNQAVIQKGLIMFARLILGILLLAAPAAAQIEDILNKVSKPKQTTPTSSSTPSSLPTDKI